MISLTILEEAACWATEELQVIYLDHCSGTMVIRFSGLGVMREIWWEDEPNTVVVLSEAADVFWGFS